MLIKISGFIVHTTAYLYELQVVKALDLFTIMFKYLNKYE